MKEKEKRRKREGRRREEDLLRCTVPSAPPRT